MYHRDGSRGKGRRRFPGRDGGAGKKRLPEWQKRAAHAAESVAAIPKPVTSIWYMGDHSKNSCERIYVLDQRLAKAGIRYFAAYGGRWFFKITVANGNRARATSIIESLSGRP
jgi:hypothetical protein